MTHTNTEQPAINELCQWFNEGDGFKQGTAAPHKWVLQANSEISRQHARIAELESQLSAIGAIGVEPLRKQAVRRAPAAPVPQWDGKINPADFNVETFRRSGNGWLVKPDNCVRITHVPTGLFEEGVSERSIHTNKAVAWQRLSDRLESLAAQGMDALNEWEDIRTLPTCDDLIWLYCQDSNTIDGPIAPEPNLEEYGWTHWSYANAPSTAWIDAALAAQAKLNVK